MIFLWTAFTLGLVSSLHCAGMCGPIVMALPLGSRANSDALQSPHYTRHLIANTVTYNTGRIGVYALIGLVAGTLGHGMQLAGIQQWVSMGLGLLMVALVLLQINWERKLATTRFMKAWETRFRVWVTRLINKKGYVSVLGLGCLNGLLPCGMVYMALAGAISMPTPGQGALFMTFFGLGTFPMLAGAFFLTNWTRSRFRSFARPVSQVAMLVAAAILLYRGAVVSFPEDLRFGIMLQHSIMCR